MATKEEIFAAKLLETFRVEAAEHVKALADGLLLLEQNNGEHPETLETIFREAHSLKGAARSVNQPAIQAVCQSLENVLSAWKNGRMEGSPQMYDVLHKTVRILEGALTKELERDVVKETTRALEQLLTATGAEVAIESLVPRVDQLIHRDPPAEAKPPVADLPQDKTIRIALSKLNQLFQESEEMLMVKLAAQQNATELTNLLNAVQSHEKELALLLAECRPLRERLQRMRGETTEFKVVGKLLAFLDRGWKDHQALKSRIRGLQRDAEQNAHFVSSLVNALLEDAKKVLMQPLATVLETFPRMIRDISRELHKQVNYESQGGDIEVDRRILEEIKDPLIHLLRNAIDHGIELPAERVQKGKPEIGTIRISAAETAGGQVEISIADDGKGFDLQKLRSAAKAQSLVSEQDLEKLSDQETMQLAFSSGISTSQTVTDLSGRGLGLGIVSEKVDKLGGRVLVDSIPDQGTVFKLVLPLTLATFRGIHITVRDRDFIIPAHNVKRVIRLHEDVLKTIADQETISLDNHTLSFVHLGDLLGLSNPPNATKATGSLFALIIRSDEKTVAFGADIIHREHEVLVKSLGKPCVRIRNIMAATIMEGGKVIPILNPTDLVRSATSAVTRTKGERKKSAATKRKRKILIAEDSMTTRLLEKNILESAGYEVIAAADGAEAYEILKTQSVDLLVTDVEMPNMDGFTLTEKVRALPATQELPIIICTGRGSKEDRERGMALGADAYLDKTSFSQSALIDATQRLL